MPRSVPPLETKTDGAGHRYITCRPGRPLQKLQSCKSWLVVKEIKIMSFLLFLVGGLLGCHIGVYWVKRTGNLFFVFVFCKKHCSPHSLFQLHLFPWIDHRLWLKLYRSCPGTKTKSAKIEPPGWLTAHCSLYGWQISPVTYHIQA